MRTHCPTSRQGNKDVLTVLDTTRRYLITDFMPARAQTPQRLDYILTTIKENTGHSPRVIRTDNALEYMSETVIQTYYNQRTRHSTTIPYTPQGISLAERINRTLLNAARAALHHSGLSHHHWEDALRDATFKYNHTMHHGTKEIPTTEWHNAAPAIPQFHIFGQLGTTSDPRQRAKIPKLRSKSRTVTYLHSHDDTHLTFMDIATSRIHRIRTVNFHPYHASRDPTATTVAAFKTYTPHKTPT